MKQFFNQKSYRTLLAVNFIFLAIIPLLILVFLSIKILSRDLMADKASINMVLARTLASEANRSLIYPENKINEIIANIENRTIDETGNLDRYLSSLIHHHDFFVSVKIINLSGDITHLAPFNQGEIGYSMKYQPYIEKAHQTNSFYWHTPDIHFYDGNISITLSKAFQNGVIISEVNLDFLGNMIKNPSAQKTGHAFITDQFGTLIAHPDKSRVAERINEKRLLIVQEGLKGNEETFRYFIREKEFLGSVAIVPKTGWPVIVTEPVEQAFEMIYKIQNFLVAATLLLLGLAICLSIWNSKRIMAPIITLAANTKKISSGDYTVSGLGQMPYAELKNLSDNFMQMTEAIKNRELELQDNEKKLLGTKNYLRDVINAINSQLISVSINGEIIQPNKAALDYLKSPFEKVVSKNVFELYPFLKAYESNILQVHSSKISQRFFKVPVDNGVQYYMDISFHSLKQSERSSIVIVIDDMTEFEKKDQLLRQAQKMETIGQLAGGIAHDFNNILSSVIGYTEYSMDDLDKNSDMYTNLNSVLEAGMRAKELVKQILTFSRHSDQEQKPIQLSVVLEEAIKLLRASVPSTINIVKNINSHAMIMGDSTRIHQVIMNVCTNSSQSMQETGGRLSIDLSETTLDSHFLAIHPEIGEGKCLNLTISDTGCGIAPDVIDKIFDPFFTTKQQSGGTGLGLSVVHGIVLNHKGAISAQSEVGKGSSFSIYLPITTSETIDIEKDKTTLPRGTETILFIDDEPEIARMNQLSLESLGYHVDTRLSSREALTAFEADPGYYDLVITDMTMPDMTGKEIARHMLKIQPDIPIILCTGFSSLINEQESLDIGIKAYLQKPVLKKDLAIKIREVLNHQG